MCTHRIGTERFALNPPDVALESPKRRLVFKILNLQCEKFFFQLFWLHSTACTVKTRNFQVLRAGVLLLECLQRILANVIESLYWSVQQIHFVASQTPLDRVPRVLARVLIRVHRTSSHLNGHIHRSYSHNTRCRVLRYSSTLIG